MKIYYLFRFTLILLFIFITIIAIRSFIPAKLSNDSIPPTIEHIKTLPTSIQKEPIYITSVVLIDPAFSNLEVNTIEDALDQWVIATNGIIEVIYQKGYYPQGKIQLHRQNTLLNIVRIKPAKETDYIIQYIDNAVGALHVGYADMTNLTDQDIKTIYIVNGRICNIQEYKTTVIHEFSHSLGLTHLRDYALMSISIGGGALCITQYDLKYFCYLHNCDAELLNPCDTAPMCSDTTFHLF
jgi:hypothetical protein